MLVVISGIEHPIARIRQSEFYGRLKFFDIFSKLAINKTLIRNKNSEDNMKIIRTIIIIAIKYSTY
jgi:hypothetical protein